MVHQLLLTVPFFVSWSTKGFGGIVNEYLEMSRVARGRGALAESWLLFTVKGLCQFYSNWAGGHVCSLGQGGQI